MTRPLALALASLLLGTPALAHPSDEWAEVRDVAQRWALALAGADLDALEEILAADFRAGFQSREGYLANVREGGASPTVTLRYATYGQTDHGYSLGPVVLTVSGVLETAFDLELREENGAIMISSLKPTALPEAAAAADLPELVATQPVFFEIVDAATGAGAFARVHIADSAGGYWPPQGHQKHIRVGWRDDVGGDVFVAGKTYAYIEPSFIADLAPGDYTLEAVKGPEYEPATLRFSVGREPGPSVRLPLRRWIDMRARGWYAADTHTHFLDDHSALLEARAEDVNVVNVLATKWGELITDTERVTGAPSVLSTDNHIVYYNEETRHGWLGHTVLQRLRELVYPLSWGGPGGGEGVPGGYDYPPMAHQADKAHAQGAIVTWAHFPSPGGEAAVDIGLGKIDTVDLFTWGDAFVGFGGPGAVDTWYAFLNTGSRLPATAGTDKMLNAQVIGSVRTYAFLGDQPLTYDAWIEAVVAGRTFVTTGPILSFSADGEPIGSDLVRAEGDEVELTTTVEIPAGYPVEVLELVYNGRVVASKPLVDGDRSVRLSARIPVAESGWFAARAHGSELLPYQRWLFLGSPGIPAMAHTSPIYLRVGDKEVWSEEDASFLAAHVRRAIVWAQNDAHLLDKDQRREMVGLFARALEVYER